MNRLLSCKKRLNIFSIILVLNLSAAVFTGGLTAAHAEQHKITENKTLRVGAYVNPPKIYKNDNNEVVGLFPDILKNIAENENWQIEYVWGTWNQCLERLENGVIDIMVDVAFSEKRALVYAFSDETVLMNWGVVYTRDDTPIDTILDLNGKTVAVMAGSIHTEGKNSIKALAKKFEIACRFIEVENYKDVFEKIENRQADAGVVNRLFGSLQKNAYDVIDSPVVFNPRHLKFAFPKKSALTPEIKELIDKNLRRLKRDSFSIYYRILNAYLAGTDKPWMILKADEKSGRLPMSEKEKAWAAAHKTVRLGFDPEFVPFEYVSKQGKYQGISSEFVRLIGERIGVTFIPMSGLTWEESIKKARQKQIDVLPCMGITKERQQFLLFSAPYLSFSRVVITRTESAVKSLDDLESLSVAVQKNSSHYGYIKEKTPINPILFSTFEAAMNSLSRGGVDAAVGNLTVATHVIRESGLSNLKIAAFVSDRSFPLSFAVRKDWPELLHLVDRALESITPAERDRIQKKWMHVEISQNRNHLFKTLLTEAELNWIKDHPVIRTGIDAGYAPYSFADGENRFDGLAVDILNRIGEMTGLEFLHEPGLSWPRIISGAENRKIDMILTCVKTDARESFLSFTDIYIPTPLVIMTRDGFPDIKKSQDLDYNRVALVRGYSSSQKVLKEHPLIEPVYVGTPLEGLKAVSSNSADAYVGVLGINIFHARQNGLTNLKVAANYNEEKNGQRMAVRKDWPLLRSILQKALQAIPLDEKSAIFQKWLPIETGGRNLHFMTLLSDEEKSWLKEHPAVHVCSDPHFAPVEFKAGDGTSSGISIDYLNLLQENIGVKFEFNNYEQWSWNPDKIKNGNPDMFSAIMETDDRKKHYLFTKPYLEVPIVIFTRSDAGYIGNLQELAGRKVITVGAYAAQELISKNYPSIDLIQAESTEHALIMLEKGDADAFAGNILTAGYYIGKLKYTSLKVAGETPFTLKMSMAVRKEFKPLLGILQKFFRYLPETEKNSIYRKWISIKYEHGTDFSALLKAVIPISILLMLSMYWVKRLKSEIYRREETEKKLSAAKKEADTANRAKSTFLASMSHEIRTPMNAILGYSQLLNRDPNLTHEQKESLLTINKSGEHLLSLINNILEISKIEAGKFEVTPNVFDLHELLKSLYLMFKARTDEKNLVFTLIQPDDLVRIIKADEGKIKQVLINLLGNAVKFTDRGSVTLRASNEKPGRNADDPFFILIEVEDTGKGISKENLTKIFQSFEQVQDVSAAEGTGLGLAISKKYAHLMNGDITVESRMNKGSLFQFKCKVEKAPEEALETKTVYRNVLRLKEDQKKIKALIADDRETNRRLLTKMLERVGFETKEVKNGEEAVNLWQTWRPQIILMDLVMPVLNGMDAIKMIRSRPGGDKPVIIAVTASVLEEEKEMVIAGGADAFLSKPFIEAELFHLIAENMEIEYIYAQEEKNDDQPRLSASESADRIKRLPPDLSEALAAALQLGHTRKIKECIDRISGHDPELFTEIKELSAAFEYQAILKLFNLKK